jgi:hypothetical protein
MVHPSAKRTGAGWSASFPFAAPVSAQVTSFWTSASASRRSFLKCPYCGSANQGGIFPVRTAALIALAHGRVSSYVMKDIGATSPGRWQL